MSFLQKKELKSAYILGLDSKNFEIFLICQEYFNSQIKTQKLNIYASSQLILFKPQGIPRDQQEREQYFQDLNFYFELKHKSLSRIFIFIDLDEKQLAEEILNCYINRFIYYSSYLTLIIYDNHKTENKLKRSFKGIQGINDIISCQHKQDVSIKILKSSGINVYPLDIQISKLCSHQVTKSKKYIEFSTRDNTKEQIFIQDNIQRDQTFRRQLISPAYSQPQIENKKNQGTLWMYLKNLCFSN